MSGKRVSPEAVARDREASRLRAAARRAAKGSEQVNLEARKYHEENKQRINEHRVLRYGADMERFSSRPFIAWDGEGYTAEDGNHHYMLFGCSMYPDSPLVGESLATEKILEYLLFVEAKFPQAFHVGFAFNYDVNMILGDLPERSLRHLASYNVCHWMGYRIEWIPGKRFTVTRQKRGQEKVSITIFDVFGFFLSRYTTSLIKYGVATEAQLAHVIEGKDDRPRFKWEDIDEVQRYWQDEISWFVPLMETLREMCYDNGLFITQWHGPGALASYMMRKRGVNQWHSKDVPPEAQIAIQTAYAGGRFQPWRCGLHRERVYTADINSAYIYACSLLPRLDNGRWRRVLADDIDRRELARFGVYRIAFNGDPDGRKTKDNHERGAFEEIYPLFHRNPARNVSWPHRTEGWYWTPEAQTVADNPSARFLEAWVYDDDGTYPFQWVNGEFDKRLALQHAGNAAEKTLKWALAAMYGGMARRVGWDKKNRKAPSSFELAWAGFITSWCRAAVYEVGYEVWRRGGLISIDTDGITSSVPFDPAWFKLGVGEKLGQWKLESFAGLLYWQTGFYWLMDEEGRWTTAKTRGIKRGSMKVDTALFALANSYYSYPLTVEAKITRTGTRFVSFKEALNQGNMKRWKRWVDFPTVSIMGNGSNAKHVAAFCVKCRYPHVETMHVLTHLPPRSIVNTPHYLPWLEEQDELTKNMTLNLDLETNKSEFIVRDSDYEDNL